MAKLKWIFGGAAMLAILAVVALWFILSTQTSRETIATRIEASNPTASPPSNAPSAVPSQGSSTATKDAPTFPDFNLTGADGQVITRDSLKGKPAIIWFTTSYCQPCQIGAQRVARLDNDLGGRAFNVLVVFVDPGETTNDLISWRNRFANPDWLVALDNQVPPLAAQVSLKYLDTKFLLDANGKVMNIDLQVANENYLNVLRQVVTGKQ